jgi:hypothetical protein
VKIEDDYIEFSTGRREYAHAGIIGLRPRDPSEKEWSISYGYDGSLDTSETEYGLTTAERIELADHMIALWQEYRRFVEAKPNTSQEA